MSILIAGCRLNMKPYTDKHGNYRCRMPWQCCGKPGDGCTASQITEAFELDEVQRMAKMRSKKGKRNAE